MILNLFMLCSLIHYFVPLLPLPPLEPVTSEEPVNPAATVLPVASTLSHIRSYAVRHNPGTSASTHIHDQHIVSGRDETLAMSALLRCGAVIGVY
ncbi:hypothetical protein BJX99DRAFT_219206 [Aspergillus californicus]